MEEQAFSADSCISSFEVVHKWGFVFGLGFFPPQEKPIQQAFILGTPKQDSHITTDWFTVILLKTNKPLQTPRWEEGTKGGTQGAWAEMPLQGQLQPRTVTRWVLSISKGGDSTTSLGNLCQCSVTLIVKKHFPMFRENLLCFSLCPSPPVLGTTEEKSLLCFLHTPLQVFVNIDEMRLDPPEPSLLQAK